MGKRRAVFENKAQRRQRETSKRQSFDAEWAKKLSLWDEILEELSEGPFKAFWQTAPMIVAALSTWPNLKVRQL